MAVKTIPEVSVDKIVELIEEYFSRRIELNVFNINTKGQDNALELISKDRRTGYTFIAEKPPKSVLSERIEVLENIYRFSNKVVNRKVVDYENGIAALHWTSKEVRW